MAKAVSKIEDTSNLPSAEVYDYGAYKGAGSDLIDNADVSIPRLKVIQGMSPEAKDEIAKEGDLVHSITKEVLVAKGGKTPIIPILYQKEYVLWRDRKTGGGIMARARKVNVQGVIRYAWDKPDTVFEDKIDGKMAVKYKTAKYIEDDGLALWGSQIPGDSDSGPAATETHNYIVALEEFDYQLIAVSLSRTAAKKAKDLNFMIKTGLQGGNVPLFALRFNIGTIIETGDGNSWANVAFTPAGKVNPTTPQFRMLAELYEGFKTKSFTIDQENEEDRPSRGSSEDAPF